MAKLASEVFFDLLELNFLCKSSCNENNLETQKKSSFMIISMCLTFSWFITYPNWHIQLLCLVALHFFKASSRAKNLFEYQNGFWKTQLGDKKIFVWNLNLVRIFRGKMNWVVRNRTPYYGGDPKWLVKDPYHVYYPIFEQSIVIFYTLPPKKNSIETRGSKLPLKSHFLFAFSLKYDENCFYYSEICLNYSDKCF